MVCASPEHFAATHVLHSLLAPRHPPSALRSLTKIDHRHRREANFHSLRVAKALLSFFRLDPESYSIVKDRAESCGLTPGRLFEAARPRLEGTSESTLGGTVGGADRDRTDDLRLAKPALSQLSYSPSSRAGMVGLGRFELPTSRLSGGRSNQLSYRPQ